MKALAKLGFSQSYTYFTWRTHKAELQEYLSEITRYPEREYFRPNFFVTTPDILPVQLQNGEPWMFKSRVALAATLSSNYGIYNGFELLEHEPIPGREEYLNSEKYEIKDRDWNKPGNIKDYLGRLNRIRREQRARCCRRPICVSCRSMTTMSSASSRSRSTATNAVAVRHRAGRHGPQEFWLHFGDITIGPRRRTRAGARDREPRHRRAPPARMGRRAPDASIRPTTLPCCFAVSAEASRAVNILPRNRRPAEDCRRRPVVQGRHHLSAARQGLPRQQWRRHRRFRRPDRAARLSARPRRHHAVAAAVLSEPRPRRRLRHRRLRRHQSRLRHDAGFPPLHAGGQAPRPARHHRAGHQPHLGPARLVQARQAAARAARARATGTSGATPTRNTTARASSSPTPRNRTGPGMPRPMPFTGTASSRTSRTSTSTIRAWSRPSCR